MKKALIVFTGILLICCSCSSPGVPEDARIKEIQRVCISGHCYHIIEIDKHEYLANGSTGGVIHLVSCTCIAEVWTDPITGKVHRLKRIY